MTIFRIIFCHILLFGIALSSSAETKTTGKTSIPDVTTHVPLKVSAAKNVNKEQTQSLNNARSDKSATKKRNVPEVLTDKNEYFDDDFYEGKGTDDYDSNQDLRTYLENSRSDNSLFDLGKYKVNGYRYYDDESRRKRTAGFGEVFSKANNYREPEIHLTPEDLMILSAYRQQSRFYNNLPPHERWTDNSVEIPDEDLETEEVYERPENFFDRYYDQRYQNWANLPPTNKLILNRKRRSFMAYPKLRVPVHKRAIL